MNYYLAKPQTHERAGTSFGNTRVPDSVNTTPPLPRKPHKLFSRNSLIFLFCIVAITLLSGCPAPAGPKGAQGDRGEQGEQGNTGEKGDAGDPASAPTLRDCHSINGYPTACYNASTGVLTFTGIDLADLGTADTADDVDTSKLSIAGKGGNDDAISLTALSVVPTVAKINDSEFSLTVDTADRKSMLDILDIGGYSASDRSPYSIVLAQNWNGLSSPALFIPVRNTNIPPGYCGDFSAEDKSGRPTLDGTANNFFGGTGTSAEDPYTLTMRTYCDDLTFDWNPNYPAEAGIAHRVYFHIIFSTSGTSDLTLTYLEEFAEPASGLYQVIEALGHSQFSARASDTFPMIVTRPNIPNTTINATMGLVFSQATFVPGGTGINRPLVGSNRLRIELD